MINADRMLADDNIWFVVRTHAQKETIALKALAAQGYRAFCPMTERTVRHARRWIDRKAPLFPSYIFLAFRPDERRWRPVNSTPGVQYLLSDPNGRPSRLQTAFVLELLAQTDEQGVFKNDQSLRPGDRVRVRSGAFIDIIGRIQGLDEKNRASLLIELMSRQVKVDVLVERLQRVA